MADKHLNADGVIKLLKGRKYKWAQVHHTWKPNHADFNGSNHQALQNGMRNYHVNTRGWQDIGQHLTLFPDGTFLTGRSFGINPAGVSGYNAGAFMIEMIGDFDKGKDKLEGKQLQAALKVYNYLEKHCGASILFHREKAAKSCPGTGIDKGKFVKAVRNFKDDGSADVSVSGGSSTSSKPTSKWRSVGANWTGQNLRKNDRGGAVKQLQKLVGVTADGMFGTDTEKAVKKAQRSAGISDDGIAGKDTYKAVKGGSKASLSVDGKWGKAVTKALQKALGTAQDGIISGQPRNSVSTSLYGGTVSHNTSNGSPMVKALQRKIGASADGKLGPATIRALQKYLGTPDDGVLSKPSVVVKELQRRLNKGNF